MKYDIYINDTIGWPISAQYIRGELKRFEGKPVTVYINSLGGSVPDALDIYQQLRDHGQATAVIFGMTASAATIIACGARRVLMSDKALLLIHRSSNWSSEWGQMNAEEIAASIRRLEKSKDTLEKIDAIIANIYARRSGGRARAEDFASTMGEELWLTASQALKMGLVDGIVEDSQSPTGMDLRRARFRALALPMPGDKKKEQQESSAQSAPSPDNGPAARPQAAPPRDNDSSSGPEAHEHTPSAPADDRRRSRIAAAVQRMIEALRPDSPEDHEHTPTATAPDDTGKKNKDNQHTNQHTNTMSKDKNQSPAPKGALAALAELLTVAMLNAAEDGSITLTAAQAEAVDTELARLAAIEDEAKTLRTDNRDLKQQLKDLGEADGDDTSRIEGKDHATDDTADEAKRVRAGYDLIKGLL